jgi:histidinol-phosphate aminotransferase
VIVSVDIIFEFCLIWFLGLSVVFVFPSDANFILFRVLNHSASGLFTFLKEQQVLIKSLANHKTPLTKCLRVTVGKAEENQAFLTALSQYFIVVDHTD